MFCDVQTINCVQRLITTKIYTPYEIINKQYIKYMSDGGRGHTTLSTIGRPSTDFATQAHTKHVVLLIMSTTDVAQCP